MKSKRYGVVNERSNPFESVIHAGEIIHTDSEIDENGNIRCVTILRDKDGCFHETYSEFVETTWEKISALIKLLNKKYDAIQTNLHTVEETMTCNFKLFNKNKNNTNPDIKKLLNASNTYEKAKNKMEALLMEKYIITQSLMNIDSIVEKIDF